MRDRGYESGEDPREIELEQREQQLTCFFEAQKIVRDRYMDEVLQPRWAAWKGAVDYLHEFPLESRTEIKELSKGYQAVQGDARLTWRLEHLKEIDGKQVSMRTHFTADIPLRLPEVMGFYRARRYLGEADTELPPVTPLNCPREILGLVAEDIRVGRKKGRQFDKEQLRAHVDEFLLGKLEDAVKISGSLSISPQERPDLLKNISNFEVKRSHATLDDAPILLPTPKNADFMLDNVLLVESDSDFTLAEAVEALEFQVDSIPKELRQAFGSKIPQPWDPGAFGYEEFDGVMQLLRSSMTVVRDDS
jgi:hypothetical protein